jgi:G:T/U-mismatch repair DNA glycosylase
MLGCSSSAASPAMLRSRPANITLSTNQFWRLLGKRDRRDLRAMAYDERLECVARHRIGLWDVIGSAAPGRQSRPGDQARRPQSDRATGSRISNTRGDRVQRGTSASIGRKLIGSDHRLTLIDLPSSSPANTRPFAEKAAAWTQLRAFCG